MSLSHVKEALARLGSIIEPDQDWADRFLEASGRVLADALDEGQPMSRALIDACDQRALIIMNEQPAMKAENQ